MAYFWRYRNRSTKTAKGSSPWRNRLRPTMLRNSQLRNTKGSLNRKMMNWKFHFGKKIILIGCGYHLTVEKRLQETLAEGCSCRGDDVFVVLFDLWYSASSHSSDQPFSIFHFFNFFVISALSSNLLITKIPFMGEVAALLATKSDTQFCRPSGWQSADSPSAKPLFIYIYPFSGFAILIQDQIARMVLAFFAPLGPHINGKNQEFSSVLPSFLHKFSLISKKITQCKKTLSKFFWTLLDWAMIPLYRI